MLAMLVRPALLGAALFTAPPALAQDYWQYDPWEGEWELHQPERGLEWEYEFGEPYPEAEREGYEWEPGQGYHEQEWYDPSDWFDFDGGVDYEWDGYDYGDDFDYDGYDYWDDYDYGYTSPYGYGGYGDDLDYGYHYDRFDDDWEYGWHYDSLDYDQDYWATEERRDRRDRRQLEGRSGRVVGLKAIRGASGGDPARVVLELRTEDGQTREVTLGDEGYVRRFLPKLEKGEKVAVGGRRVDVNGRKLFKAEEIRSKDSVYSIPEYEYQRTIRGKLVGLKQLRTREGNLEALVARVEDPRGKKVDVLLGPEEALRGRGTSVRPGARVSVEGYQRSVDGERTFVVQDVRVLDRDRSQPVSQRARQEQARQERARQQRERQHYERQREQREQREQRQREGQRSGSGN